MFQHKWRFKDLTPLNKTLIATESISYCIIDWKRCLEMMNEGFSFSVAHFKVREAVEWSFSLDSSSAADVTDLLMLIFISFSRELHATLLPSKVKVYGKKKKDQLKFTKNSVRDNVPVPMKAIFCSGKWKICSGLIQHHLRQITDNSLCWNTYVSAVLSLIHLPH